MSVAFAQCLGVRYKQDQAKISLYPCNKESEFQKWGCINSTLVIHGENLFLSIGKRKKDNIVLDSGSGTMNKWKIFGTTDDLCSQDYKGKAWRLVLIVSCDCLPSQAGFISAPHHLRSAAPHGAMVKWKTISSDKSHSSILRHNDAWLQTEYSICAKSCRFLFTFKTNEDLAYFFFLIFSFKLSTLVYLIGW